MFLPLKNSENLHMAESCYESEKSVLNTFFIRKAYEARKVVMRQSLSPLFRTILHTMVVVIVVSFSRAPAALSEMIEKNPIPAEVALPTKPAESADILTPRKEQMPEHLKTPAIPYYDAGKADAVERKAQDKGAFKLAFGDSIFEVSSRLRIEGLYGVNLRFLNNQNNDRDPQLDKVAFPGRHTMDTWFLYTYGKERWGYDVTKFRLGLRNRAVWGNETSNLPTSGTMVKVGDAIVGNHTHAITPKSVLGARDLVRDLPQCDLGLARYA